ncbi:translation initiation factor IF-2 [Plesiocystis pacifica SIR-1]|uniref:Translation initiation factor IF-2 n=1 Tax=Plesiocystis pacifica SIR-1 TaxID=391625 RepID=A6G5J6_9BACT|nr:translation initiation factor IF-2 N-terminal domain-containing protein [Plesiocystis pacifica]EDM78777.1 translation initiation factor IF-2 [Plesiocystis pacifica SIR-1]
MSPGPKKRKPTEPKAPRDASAKGDASNGKEGAAEADKPSAGGGRVIRDADGVIVGSKGAGPKILGFVDIKPKAKPKPKAGAGGGRGRGPGSRGPGRGKPGGPKREIVIDKGGGGPDQPKGRASARKAREVRSVRRPHHGRPVRRSGKPSSAGTAEMSADKKRVRVDGSIALGELAKQMGVKAPKVVRILWGMGIRNANPNFSIDLETAELVAAEFDYRVEDVSFHESELLEAGEGELEGEPRAPVVTVMGHVDHGKTTLLDRLRKAEVAAGEAGGITQHVGAYRVQTNAGPVVFVDTPGHAAFSAMRERGAQLTDIVVLIVAANDGVMPTTVEAIQQIRKAEVAVVVAINKCDLPSADPAKVERQLMEHQILSETYGGDVPFVQISAKTGAGVDDLLEQIALLGEVLELRATAEGRASGLVLESRIDKGRGVITTLLVQSGTLNRGDVVVAGESSGRVSALIPSGDLPVEGEVEGEGEGEGKKAKKAKKKPKKDKPKKKDKKKAKPAAQVTVQSSGPATVVEVAGLDEAPAVGIAFNVVEDEKAAKQLIGHRRELRRRDAKSGAPSFAERLAAERRAELPTIALVIRADVQGSLEAVEQVFAEIRSEKVSTKIIAAGVGAVTEGDIKLATTARQSGGNVTPAIFGFGVKGPGKVTAMAEAEGIPLQTSKVIYELGDKLEALMLAQLQPSYVEHDLGKAEVRKLFPTSQGVVCGCRVVSGKITRNAGVRVVRDGERVGDAKLASLRIVNRDVKEVGTDQECGILLSGANLAEEGDVLEAFELEAIAPTL